MANDEFYEAADRLIHLANEMNQEMPTSRVSSIMMYANARYNAFNFHATDGRTENEEKAIDYYCEQYRKMLIDNMKEIKEAKGQQNKSP